jgi:hypothetical protein
MSPIVCLNEHNWIYLQELHSFSIMVKKKMRYGLLMVNVIETGLRPHLFLILKMDPSLAKIGM